MFGKRFRYKGSLGKLKRGFPEVSHGSINDGEMLEVDHSIRRKIGSKKAFKHAVDGNS